MELVQAMQNKCFMINVITSKIIFMNLFYKINKLSKRIKLLRGVRLK